MKERIKSFIENLTPGAKIKYIAVTVLVLAIVASIAVFSAVNNSKEPNEVASTESLTIEFDEEIVLDFGDGEDDTDTAAESESVTEESEPAEESKKTEKATESEKESEKETEKETEKATEKEETEPATPSEDTEKTEPKPVVVPETQAPQTQPAVTQKPQTQAPVTQKPATQAPVTQAPATQAPATQAPVTQAPATQAPVTQAPATQAPATQAPVTKPTVSEPEEEKNYGSWVVKQKKYYYDTPAYVIYYAGMDDMTHGPTEPGNVMILSVENKSDEAYTITIDGKYLDANGNVIGTERKTFEGFAANWSNYFVFAPGIEFDKFTFEFSAKKYSGETYVQYFERFDDCGVRPVFALDAGNGRESYSVDEAGIDSMKQVVKLFGGVRCGYTGPGIVDFTGDIVLFDKNGELVYIRERGKGNVAGSPSVGEGRLEVPLSLTDHPYSKIDSYKIPDNLTSVTGFYAIRTFVRK